MAGGERGGGGSRAIRAKGEAPELVTLQIWVCSSYGSDASVACISDLENLQLWKQKREREQ